MSALISNAANAYANIGKLGGSSIPSIGGIDPASDTSGKPAFSELVGTALEKAMSANYQGEATSVKAIAGKAELHELVTAVSNAELSLNTVVAIRDKVINAYQDILKMPI